MSDQAAEQISLALTPTELLRDLRRCMYAKLVPIVRSSPAIGKSEIIRALAAEMNLYVLDFRLAQADITDLNGFPRINEEGFAEFVPFDSFPVEGMNPPEGYVGWLIFFDELTAAPKQIQAAAYKIILERLVGNKKLHTNVKMIAAGNLTTDNAVAHEMSTALQSRLVHLELGVSKNDWLQWAINQKIDSRILGFIEFKPDLLYTFKPDHDDYTYASPRTWYFTHRLIHGEPVGMKDLGILAGTISKGVAQEFITFTEIYDQLPTIGEILANPETCKIPQEVSVKYAMGTFLADHFNATDAAKLITYMERMPPECQIVCMRIVNVRQPKLMRDPNIMSFFQGLLSLM